MASARVDLRLEAAMTETAVPPAAMHASRLDRWFADIAADLLPSALASLRNMPQAERFGRRRQDQCDDQLISLAAACEGPNLDRPTQTTPGLRRRRRGLESVVAAGKLRKKEHSAVTAEAGWLSEMRRRASALFLPRRISVEQLCSASGS